MALTKVVSQEFWTFLKRISYFGLALLVVLVGASRSPAAAPASGTTATQGLSPMGVIKSGRKGLKDLKS